MAPPAHVGSPVGLVWASSQLVTWAQARVSLREPNGSCAIGSPQDLERQSYHGHSWPRPKAREKGHGLSMAGASWRHAGTACGVGAAVWSSLEIQPTRLPTGRASHPSTCKMHRHAPGPQGPRDYDRGLKTRVAPPTSRAEQAGAPHTLPPTTARGPAGGSGRRRAPGSALSGRSECHRE